MNQTHRNVSLARALSKLGYCSRTQAAQLIEQKKVQVNGSTKTNPNFRVDLNKDSIVVEGEKIFKKKEYQYLLFHKPVDVVTTRSDEQGRKTVYEYLPKQETFLFPVGRLDKDTSGALLFTNDTQLGERLTNPKYKSPKMYFVVATGIIADESFRELRNGILIEDYKTLPAKISNIKRKQQVTECEITITEGKNRQLRKMFEAIGHPIISLHRKSISTLYLGNIAVGKFRSLTEKEIVGLKNSLRDF